LPGEVHELVLDACGKLMSLAKKLGATCLVVAFVPISQCANAADFGGAPREPQSVPQVSSYINPASSTGLYGGISAA
jgi:hypothetical protein